MSSEHSIKSIKFLEIECWCGWKYRLQDAGYEQRTSNDNLLDMHGIHAKTASKEVVKK